MANEIPGSTPTKEHVGLSHALRQELRNRTVAMIESPDFDNSSIFGATLILASLEPQNTLAIVQKYETHFSAWQRTPTNWGDTSRDVFLKEMADAFRGINPSAVTPEFKSYIAGNGGYVSLIDREPPAGSFKPQRKKGESEDDFEDRVQFELLADPNKPPALAYKAGEIWRVEKRSDVEARNRVSDYDYRIARARKQAEQLLARAEKLKQYRDLLYPQAETTPSPSETSE